MKNGATPRLAVIIPTLNAGPEFASVLESLKRQTVPPETIVVIDSSSRDGTADIARKSGCDVEVITREEFNHGGTRNRGARKCKQDFLIYMTQDAIPARDDFLKNLIAPLVKGPAVAAYARQLPRKDAYPPEVFARNFNYPEQSQVKALADLPRLGIKAYFFSDVASAIRSDIFWKLGGFPEDVIMNEDMLFCARMLKGGYEVAYEANALVIHSHNYGLAQQFRRYFDIGVFRSRANELAGAGASGEGVRFVARQLRYLWGQREWRWIPFSTVEAACKFAAFHLGKNEWLLPRSVKRSLSMHKAFWLKKS